MSGVIALKYFCYQCQANRNVFRAPMPICATCNSRFVEKIRDGDNENELRSDENREPDQISEQLNSRLSFQPGREQDNDNNSNSNSSTDELVTDDGDENYEDIDEYEEDDDEEDNNDDEDDDDSDFEIQPWSRYYDEDYSEDEEEIFLNPWRRYYRRAAEEDSVSQSYGLGDNNSLLTEVDHEHYPHHDDYHHSHLDSDVIPMVEHLLSTLSARVEGLEGDDSEHDRLSSMLQDMLHNLDSPVQRVAASSEQIEKLEKRKLQDGDIDVETECIICQDTFGIDAELIKMPCKHEYHGKCIRHWLSVSTTCPMCRSSLPADERLPPCPASEDGEQQHQNENNGTMPPHRARTFTFQSPAGSTTVGIWVADPNALPPGLQHLDPHYTENEDDDHQENEDEDEDEFDNVSYDYDGSYYEFDEIHNEVDDEDDEDDLLRNFGHPILRMCPHGFPHPVTPTLRQNPSNTTTRREQQQNPHQFNPMDEVD